MTMNNMNQEETKKGVVLWYYQKTGKWLDLQNPRSFNEKIQWLKLYDNDNQKSSLSDRFQAHSFAKEKIGDNYIIPILGVYNSFDEIDFSVLPRQFVIKASQGHDFCIVVKDRNAFDKIEAKKVVNGWISTRHGKDCYEIQNQVAPKIIIEKFIQQENETVSYIYMCYCFDGHVKYIQTKCVGNEHDYHTAIYDTQWNKQNWIYVPNSSWQKDNKKIKKPTQLEQMIILAEKLSSAFKFVRCDFYLFNNEKLYFDKMAFYPTSGIGEFVPSTNDKFTPFLLLHPTK